MFWRQQQSERQRHDNLSAEIFHKRRKTPTRKQCENHPLLPLVPQKDQRLPAPHFVWEREKTAHQKDEQTEQETESFHKLKRETKLANTQEHLESTLSVPIKMIKHLIHYHLLNDLFPILKF